MYPYFYLFGIPIPAYGTFTAIGVAASIALFIWAERREGLRRYTVNRMIFAMIIGLIVMWISAFLFNSLFHSIELGEIRFGGITWLGGVIGCFIFMIIAFHVFVPEAKGNAFKYFSLMIPGMVLGHAFGRVGCFFAGCCFGRPTTSFLGVVFPEGSIAANTYGYGTPVLPTQLFEAVFELALFVVMISTFKKTRYFECEIYMIAYGAFRFILEFFRGDDRGSTGFFLTPAQFFCVLMAVFGVFTILTRKGITFKKIHAKLLLWQNQAIEQMEIVDKQVEDSKAMESIGKLYELKQKGIISETEYEERKKKLLEKI